MPSPPRLPLCLRWHLWQKPRRFPLPRKLQLAKGKKRSRFGVSASDLVLAFVKAKKSPTTKEITQHLLSEGRSLGATSNALSTLAKAKKLKRTPLGKGVNGQHVFTALRRLFACSRHQRRINWPTPTGKAKAISIGSKPSL